MLMPDVDQSLIRELLDTHTESVIWFKAITSANGSGIEQLEDFHVGYCNNAACEFLNAPPEKVIGTSLKESILVDKQSSQIIFEQCLRVYESGQREEFIYYNQKLQKHFNVLRSKINDGVLSVTRDFTEKVNAERLKQEQNDLLNSILDSSINGIFACEAIRSKDGNIADLRFIKINKAFCAFIGKAAEEAIGSSFLQQFPASKNNGAFDMNCEVINTGKPQRREIYYKGEGIDGWFDVSLVKLGIDGLVVTYTDITDTKNNQQQLQDAALYLQSVIDASQTGICLQEPVRNSNGEIVDFIMKIVNETLAAYAGASKEVIIGKPIIEWFPSYKTTPLFDMYVNTVITGERRRIDLHYSMDGVDAWIDIMSSKLGNDILVTFHDYTPLKKLQIQLEESVTELKKSQDKSEHLIQLNQYKDEFIGMASHELKTPVSSIKSYLQILARNLEDGTNKEFVTKTLRHVNKLTDLISDLLDVSKIHAGKLQLNFTSFLIENVISESIDTVAHTTESHMIMRHSTAQGVMVYADYQRIEQVVINLLTNAAKYSPNAHSIVVHTHATDKEVIVCVQDFGIGISEKDAAKIFNRFYRVEGLSPSYSGLGIGLYISSEIIKRHNGRIWVESKEGEGSSFYFSLPIQSE